MPVYRANDKYRATLRSTWVYDPADTSLAVTAIPDNLPTIVVVGWETDFETKFTVTGSSGDSASNYTLTGATVISGGTENIPEQTPVNCLNNEEFFNQYETLLGGLTDMYETSGLELTQISTPASPSSGSSKLYFKSDGKAYILTSAGVEVALTTVPRTNTVASHATPTINTDTTDIFTITALATAITSMTTNLSGSPVNGQKLIIRIKDDGTARAITWGPSFASRGATLPTKTVLGKYQYNGFIYNDVAEVWDLVATCNEA